MQKLQFAFWGAVVLMALAACDQTERRTVTDAKSGEQVNLELGSGASAPADMPDFASRPAERPGTARQKRLEIHRVGHA
jgi:hypothetical protein